MKTEVAIMDMNLDRETTVSGEKVGPFVVHRMGEIVLLDWSHPKWGVTHAQTGLAAASGPTKRCCMHAARRLRDIGMDWDFSDMSTCLDRAQPFRAQIKAIREACRKGELA